MPEWMKEILLLVGILFGLMPFGMIFLTVYTIKGIVDGVKWVWAWYHRPPPPPDPLTPYRG